MKHRYYFCEEYREELVQLLERYYMKYRFAKLGKLLKSYVYFDLCDDHKEFEECFLALKRMGIEDRKHDVLYADDELANAKLLKVTPQKQCIDIVNEYEAFRYACVFRTLRGDYTERHETQIGDIAIAKEPSLKSSIAMWSISTGFSELFVSFQVKELVEKENLVGVKCRNVRIKKKGYSDRIYQLTTDRIISQNCYIRTGGERIIRCPVCGRDQIVLRNNWQQLHFDLNQVELDSDLYMTERCFGAGTPEPLYLISQKFYRALKKNNLISGISFAPIVDS